MGFTRASTCALLSGILALALLGCGDRPGHLVLLSGGKIVSVSTAGKVQSRQALQSSWDEQFYRNSATSPKGDRIAVTNNGDCGPVVLTGKLGSGPTTELHNLLENPCDGANTDFASWSPDGKSVALVRYGHGHAYDRNHNNRSGSQVYIVDIDHPAEATSLTSGGAFKSFPAWSPDGRTIAYGSFDLGPHGKISGGRLMVVKTDGDTGPRQIGPRLRAGAYLSGLSWSPNGKRVAYARVPSPTLDLGDSPVGFGAGIYAIGADGTGMTQVARGPDSFPAWAPDGSRIAFLRAAGPDTVDGVFAVSANGGPPEQMVSKATVDSYAGGLNWVGG